MKIVLANKIPTKPGTYITIHKGTTSVMYVSLKDIAVEEMHPGWLSGSQWSVEPIELESNE